MTRPDPTDRDVATLGDLHFTEIRCSLMAFVGGSLSMFVRYLPR